MSTLVWQSALIVHVPYDFFTKSYGTLQVSRAHLALHPDGVLMSNWDVPINERIFPRAQLVGWKPLRDVPFRMPVRFNRSGESCVQTLIPRGAWVLPYDHNRYMVLHQLCTMQQHLLKSLHDNPVDPQLEQLLMHWATIPTDQDSKI